MGAAHEHQGASGQGEQGGGSGDEPSISLLGSVSLGTGVMIGAGIFALVGQVAVLAGGSFPLAFIGGAIVAGVSSYAYARGSSSDPSAGGIAMILKRAYGPGVIAGSCSLFMYVSMVVAESLLARTFGTYMLRPFELQDSALLVPALGVLAIAAAVVVNVIGNRLVERSATITAALKIGGIGVLAVAGVLGALAAEQPVVLVSRPATGEDGVIGVLAGIGLSVLAYKGFTTITNQGADIREPARNIPRSIAIAILVCAALYLLITVAVASSLTLPQLAQARDYALAQAAEPLFGRVGVALTGAVAVVATLSGLVASLFSVSRLYAMLQEMGQVPRLPSSVPHEPLLVTAALAALATVLMDLSRIASVGLLLYLVMDLAIQWGVLARLREEAQVRAWIPAVSIALTGAVLVAFVAVTVAGDLLTVAVGAGLMVSIVAAQALVARRSR